ILGGVLLGLGAYINRACVFGAIARLGSGEWSYAVTPLGFYVGCITLPLVFTFPAQQKLPYGSPVLQASMWLIVPFATFVVWRLASALPVLLAVTRFADRQSEDRTKARASSPHVATTVIGITFFCMLLLVGAWAYTDVLAELARGMAGNII